jgi:hypothetical protein
VDDIGIGKIILSLGQQRDAIHVAVAPLKASCALRPGTHIGVNADGFTDLKARKIGIVDPFLKEPVKPGETFWFFLYPGTITSLRHDWTHPSMLAPHNTQDDAVSASRSWLERFAMDNDVRYTDLIESAQNIATDGESYLPGLSDGLDILPEFWEHFQNVTGKAVAAERRGDYFSCSC